MIAPTYHRGTETPRKTSLCVSVSRCFAIAALALLGGLTPRLANAQNGVDADGTTPLHRAAYADDLARADSLLRAGADVNAANDLGATPLWLASLNGSAPMARRLLDAGANPNRALVSGETPLMVAARGGYAEVVQLLASKGGNVNARGARGQTALMWAVAQSHPSVVQALLARGADIHAKTEVWGQVMAVPPHGHADYNRWIPHGGETALLFAARAGDLESATRLVASGANVQDADAWGVSAMVLAAHAGHRDVVEFLLEKGADPNASAPGFTALHLAIMRRDEPMAAALLARGADPNAPLKTWTPTRRASADWNFPPPLVGASPFWLAARVTHPGIMRLLAKHGANPKFVHRSDFYLNDMYDRRAEATTALMAATGMGIGGRAWFPPPREAWERLALEAVQVAVELGADLDAANTDGRTALDAAQAMKYESVVRFLVEKGARSGKAGR
jgi:ankyrin repeat protein